MAAGSDRDQDTHHLWRTQIVEHHGAIPASRVAGSYDLATGKNATAAVADGSTLPDDKTLSELRPWIITTGVMLVIWGLIVTTFGVRGLVK